MKQMTNQLRIYLIFCGAAITLQACYSPAHSQEYFIKASREDPALEPLYSTSLYTVYYDHALLRCVLHSTHTWGQSGGGGGGTGIGIHAFGCDPDRIRRRAQGVGLQVYPAKINRPSKPIRRGNVVAPQRAAPAVINSSTQPPPSGQSVTGGAQ